MFRIKSFTLTFFYNSAHFMKPNILFNTNILTNLYEWITFMLTKDVPLENFRDTLGSFTDFTFTDKLIL